MFQTIWVLRNNIPFSSENNFLSLLKMRLTIGKPLISSTRAHKYVWLMTGGNFTQIRMLTRSSVIGLRVKGRVSHMVAALFSLPLVLFLLFFILIACDVPSSKFAPFSLLWLVDLVTNQLAQLLRKSQSALETEELGIWTKWSLFQLSASQVLMCLWIPWGSCKMQILI